MGLSILTKHALKGALGHKAGEEVSRILDAVATELEAHNARKVPKAEPKPELVAQAPAAPAADATPAKTTTATPSA